MSHETSATTAPPSHPLAGAFSLVRTGEIVDLDSGRWPGMPLWSGHPPFQLVTYRTPAGLRNQADQAWLGPDVNKTGFGIISELLIATCHSGTHIDALSHITTGASDCWHGGTSASQQLGDFGPLTDDAAALPVFITRGVLVDVAAAFGVDRLPAGHPVTADEVRRTLDVQGTELRQGDVVLVRTGQMSVWPDQEAMAQTKGAGVDLDAAQMFVDAGAVAVGADTESCEVVPSTVPGNPHPVHDLLLVRSAVYIIENIMLEPLSTRQAYEFLFLALPLKITGATASMLRPVAVL